MIMKHLVKAQVWDVDYIFTKTTVLEMYDLVL